MRIIAGRMRGKVLAAVGKGDAAAHLRPTTDRVRENIFNVLMGGTLGDPITDARILDLFAGTGALGLEALSRGGQHALFIDNGQIARAILHQNIELTRSQDQSAVLAKDALTLGRNPQEPFDLVFLDPPYGKSLGEKTLSAALAGGWLAENALIVWEENAPPTVPAGFTQLDQRKYGDTVVTILEPR